MNIIDLNNLSDDYVLINHPRFIIEIGYAVKENMTGIAAYEKVGLGNRAIVHKKMWKKLEKLIPYLEQHNIYLKIFDAYRPPKAFDLMKKIIPIKGYFAPTAEHSQHCHATAIDCCLCDSNKEELSYPTNLDAYSEENAKLIQDAMKEPEALLNVKMEQFQKYLKKATHDYFEKNMKTEIKNREELKGLMESVGLLSIPSEWWHYNLFPRDEYNNLPMADFIPLKNKKNEHNFNAPS